eukprot:TRINITY_DN714_c0_g1_i10.p1 TRINITY_DN714_c0_g1~~TRINITY_DN714_c0_g1_i10.p1  ORF type:complete len:525 (-),score=80.00 TRINITY_DN714_c0_g1_i10:492-2066(-)
MNTLDNQQIVQKTPQKFRDTANSPSSLSESQTPIKLDQLFSQFGASVQNENPKLNKSFTSSFMQNQVLSPLFHSQIEAKSANRPDIHKQDLNKQFDSFILPKLHERRTARSLSQSDISIYKNPAYQPSYNLESLQKHFGGNGLTVAGIPYYRLKGSYKLKITKDISFSGNVGAFQLEKDGQLLQEYQTITSIKNYSSGEYEKSIQDLNKQLQQCSLIISSLKWQLNEKKVPTLEQSTQITEEISDLKVDYNHQLLASQQEQNEELQRRIEALEKENLDLKNAIQLEKLSAQELSNFKQALETQVSDLILKNNQLQKIISDYEQSLNTLINDLSNSNSLPKKIFEPALNNQFVIEEKINCIKQCIEFLQTDKKNTEEILNKSSLDLKQQIESNQSLKCGIQELKSQLTYLKLKAQLMLTNQISHPNNELYHEDIVFAIEQQKEVSSLLNIKCAISLNCTSQGELGILVKIPSSTNFQHAKLILESISVLSSQTQMKETKKESKGISDWIKQSGQTILTLMTKSSQ